MSGVEKNQRDAAFRGAGCVLAGFLATLTVGCSQAAFIGGIQVQFYSPEGANVVLREGHGASPVVVRSRGPLGDRLERNPDDLAVFDLPPGTYDLAYTYATGAEDAVIYGELEIHRPGSKPARQLCEHTFIPIKLPSMRSQVAEHRFPSRDLSYTVGLEGREFNHLKQGDLITKVYFVADLERAKQEYDVEHSRRIAVLDSRLVVLDDRELYLDVRYQDERRRALHRDPEMNIEDKIAHQRFDRFGIQERFIKTSQKRQKLLAEREAIIMERGRLEDERARRGVLLRSMKIIHRRGALVLATPDLQLPYTDPVAQARELGEVVAVLRVGGRHKYWAADALAFHADAGDEVAAEITGDGDAGITEEARP